MKTSGIVKNGVIVLDGSVLLPEGTRVVVTTQSPLINWKATSKRIEFPLVHPSSQTCARNSPARCKRNNTGTSTAGYVGRQNFGSLRQRWQQLDRSRFNSMLLTVQFDDQIQAPAHLRLFRANDHWNHTRT